MKKSLLYSKAIQINMPEQHSPITSPITASSHGWLDVIDEFNNFVEINKTAATRITCSTNWVIDGMAVFFIE